MKIELADCENTILGEIEMPEIRQRDVAQTYALILKSSESAKVNWARINKAILKRWTLSGLKKIKNMAWSGRCFVTEEKP